MVERRDFGILASDAQSLDDALILSQPPTAPDMITLHIGERHFAWWAEGGGQNMPPSRISDAKRQDRTNQDAAEAICPHRA